MILYVVTEDSIAETLIGVFSTEDLAIKAGEEIFNGREGDYLIETTTLDVVLE